MKKLKIIVILLICSLIGYSQTYISVTPTVSNSPGTMYGKTNLSIECGYQYNVLSIGLATGKTSLIKMKNDTTIYAELRTNLNVFQQGQFTNTITIGMGRVFNAQNYLLTELSYSIEYDYSEQFHINLIAGQYYFSGINSLLNENVIGISFVY